MKVEIANCKECGRLYQRVSREICPECLRNEEALFSRVKEYIRAHGHASIPEICGVIDISEEKLMKFMRDGRLISTNAVDYPCERCGKPIRAGKMCEKCQANLQAALSQAARKIDQAAGSKEGPSYYSRRK